MNADYYSGYTQLEIGNLETVLFEEHHIKQSSVEHMIVVACTVHCVSRSSLYVYVDLSLTSSEIRFSWPENVIQYKQRDLKMGQNAMHAC